MARGYGLMGEAGPEAVMPLRRSQDGKLGVVAAGRGGVVVNMNIINNAGSDVQVRQQSQARQNSDGSISLDVVIERAVRNAVNSDVANNGPMTQGLARRFNLNSAAGIA
jgi:phage-related minor tail protein